MAKEDNGFVFFRSYYEALNELPEPEQVELLNMMLSYVFDGELKRSKIGYLNAIFEALKVNIDYSLRKRRTAIINGSQGGAPEGSINNPQGNNQYSKAEDNQSVNQQDNQSDNQSDNQWITLREENTEGIRREYEGKTEGNTEKGSRGEPTNKPIEKLTNKEIHQIAKDLGLTQSQAIASWGNLYSSGFIVNGRRYANRSDFIDYLMNKYDLKEI